MNINWLLIAVFVIGLASLIGYFATSTLLLLLVLVISCLFFAAGKIEPALLSNLLFAIIGFAGGLFTPKEKSSADDSKPGN